MLEDMFLLSDQESQKGPKRRRGKRRAIVLFVKNLNQDAYVALSVPDYMKFQE